MIGLDYFFVFLTFVLLILTIVLAVMLIFKKVSWKAPVESFVALIICFVIAGLIGSLGIKPSTANQNATVGNYTIYKTKVTKVSYAGSGDWKISGKTSAPSDTKIIVTPANEGNINYGDISAESAGFGDWAKVKKGKFTVLADAVGLSNATKPKAGSKVKVLIFAIKNYKKSWDKSEISTEVVKKAKPFGTVNLFISKKQARYIASLDPHESSSSSSETSSSYSSSSSENESSQAESSKVDDVVNFESAFNEAVGSSKGQIKDIKYSTSSDGSSINSIDVVINDIYKYASRKQKEKITQSVLDAISSLSSSNNIKEPPFTVTSEDGTKISSYDPNNMSVQFY